MVCNMLVKLQLSKGYRAELDWGGPHELRDTKKAKVSMLVAEVVGLDQANIN